jgi:hypothetical protein
MEAATEAPYTPHSLRYGVPLPSRANATNDDLASLDLRDEHSNIEAGNRASSLAAAKAQDTSLRVQHEITSPVPRDIACKATRPCSSNESISELDTNQTKTVWCAWSESATPESTGKPVNANDSVYDQALAA